MGKPTKVKRTKGIGSACKRLRPDRGLRRRKTVPTKPQKKS